MPHPEQRRRHRVARPALRRSNPHNTPRKANSSGITVPNGITTNAARSVCGQEPADPPTASRPAVAHPVQPRALGVHPNMSNARSNPADSRPHRPPAWPNPSGI